MSPAVSQRSKYTKNRFSTKSGPVISSIKVPHWFTESKMDYKKIDWTALCNSCSRHLLTDFSFGQHHNVYALSSLSSVLFIDSILFSLYDNNSEMIRVLSILVTNVSKVVDLVIDTISCLHTPPLFTLFSDHVSFSLCCSSSYIRLCSMWSGQSWSSVTVWWISCIKNSDNAIPPVSHCLVINKVDIVLIKKDSTKNCYN